MASTNGRTDAPLSEQLFREPYRFDFFQAVRLLERLARGAAGRAPQPVGYDHPPDQEAVRFRAHNSLSFPAAPIQQLQWTEAEGQQTRPPEMTVNFMGLTGPSGVLPLHYTRLLIQRLRLKDQALRDFFDLFNHRTISLFYRAWEKYRVPLVVERSQRQSAEDVISHCLYCLVGLGTNGQRGRHTFADSVFLYYGGHFAHFPRNAAALEAILQDYFEFPLSVQQMHGQWLYLDEEDQTQLSGLPSGHLELGVDVLVGSRVWDVQSKFRLRVGPVSTALYHRLLPDGDMLQPLAQLTRAYVGADLDFDIQLVLKGIDVPRCQLASATQIDSARLGWNTWLFSRPIEKEVDDAVFFLSDV
jgi:type VI secretion system protein ImpH